MPMQQANSVPLDASKGEGERVRFVGRHSKDNFLSIYLQKRNIVERDSGGNGRAECESLGCIVRVHRERAAELHSKGQSVVVGVLARLVCDFGLQYTEHALYQLETCLYPNPTPINVEPHDRKNEAVFDLTSRFVTSLPDEWHLPLLIKLPPGLPSSVMMRGTGGLGSSVSWGLTWYVFAYIASEQSVHNTLVRHGVDGVWPRLRLGRRHSKVFLSFGKTVWLAPSTLLSLNQTLPVPAGSGKRRTLLGASNPLLLEAYLEKTIFRVGEPIPVTIKLRNSGRHRVSGIRITVKQLISVKCGSDPKHAIKTTLKEYDVVDFCSSSHATFDTVFTVNTDYDALRPSGYQLGMECQLPRRDEIPPTLSASSIFMGPQWSRGEACAFGIDRLRLFSIEYYINVHAVIPWASNVIVRLPFRLASSDPASSASNALGNKMAAPMLSALDRPSSLRPHNNGELVKGNLISFDFEQEPGSGQGDDFDLEEDRERPAEPFASATTTNPSDAKLSYREGGGEAAATIVWIEDLKLARAALETGLGEIRKAHYSLMESPLDSRSLALQCSSQRVTMNQRLIEQINALVTQDLPRLKLALETAHGGKGRAGTHACAAQMVAARLLALGLAHVPLVHLCGGGGASRQRLREERLEAFSRIVDDFELFLARAQRSSPDAGDIIDRLSEQAFLLVQDLASGYARLEGALKGLLGTLLSLKFATITSRKFCVDDEAEDYLSAMAEDGASMLVLEDEGDELIAAMASQFQAINAFLLDNPRDRSPNFADFPQEFVHYTARLQVLLASDLPRERTSVAAYFHWRFLLAVAEHFFTGCVGGSWGRLLLSELRGSLRWSPSEVEQRIPARFLLPLNPDEELRETAAQIVAVMQRL